MSQCKGCGKDCVFCGSCRHLNCDGNHYYCNLLKERLAWSMDSNKDTLAEYHNGGERNWKCLENGLRSYE